MTTLPTLTAYDPNLIPNKATMTDEEFADAIHPYLNFWNETTIPEINNWSLILEQIRQEIHNKYIAVKNQAINGGYSQAYLDTKYNPPMSRTYYVDAVNGSDTNDGSNSYPFKTIKKAVDSTPTGGYVYIVLKSDYVFESSAEAIVKRNIYIWIVGNNTYSLIFKVRQNGSYNTLSYFRPLGFFGLVLYDVDITIDISTEDPNLNYDTRNQVIAKTYSSSGFVQILHSNINLPDSSNVSLLCQGHGHTLEFLPLKLYNVDINGTANSKLILSYSGTILLFTNDTRLNTNGTWSDLLAGVIRDADGKPRNVLSNIVL